MIRVEVWTGRANMAAALDALRSRGIGVLTSTELTLWAELPDAPDNSEACAYLYQLFTTELGDVADRFRYEGTS